MAKLPEIRKFLEVPFIQSVHLQKKKKKNFPNLSHVDINLNVFNVQSGQKRSLPIKRVTHPNNLFDHL